MRVRLYGYPESNDDAGFRCWSLTMDWVRDGLGLDPLVVLPGFVLVDGGTAKLRTIRTGKNGERLTERAPFSSSLGAKPQLRYAKSVVEIPVRCAPPAELVVA